MLQTLTVRARGQVDPFRDRPAQRSIGTVVRNYLTIVGALIGGAGIALRQGLLGTRETVSLEYATATARATVTAAAVNAADTVTPNGVTLTSAQHRASCTVTVASIQADDTVTVNGVVFTGKAEPTGNYQFDSDGTDTAVATALVAKINAATINSADAINGAGVYGKIEAKNSAGVITLYAITEGTVGNAYTIETSNGTRLGITNDDSGLFANGAAAVNNEFDHIGSNIRTARSLADCINGSTSAAVSNHVKASTRRAVVTCASVGVGDWVDVDGTRLYANGTATDSGGARIATAPDNQWYQGSTDTNDAISLVNCINAHPVLSERFLATNSSGVVTLHERWPEVPTAERPTIATSDATRLAITGTAGTAYRFEDSAGCLIQSKRSGVGGNSLTIATGNGSRLAITNDSSGRLTGGASTTVSV